MINWYFCKAQLKCFFSSACCALALLLLAVSYPISAEVPEVCVDRFLANDAIPGAENCAVQALASPSGLSNFACTGPAGEEIIVEYCGLVDDDQCDFQPAETPGGTIIATNGAGPFIAADVIRVFDAQYGTIVSLGSATNLLLLFPAIFGLADLVYFDEDDIRRIDLGSQFSGLGDFGGLINNLEDCP